MKGLPVCDWQKVSQKAGVFFAISDLGMSVFNGAFLGTF